MKMIVQLCCARNKAIHYSGLQAVVWLAATFLSDEEMELINAPSLNDCGKHRNQTVQGTVQGKGLLSAGLQGWAVFVGESARTAKKQYQGGALRSA